MSLLRAVWALWQLSLRRLFWSTSTLVVLLPTSLLLVVCWAASRARRPVGESFQDFSQFFVLVGFAGLLVPLVTLAYGTSSVGGDREDRTLLFLLVRPIPRPILLLTKTLATLPLVLGVLGGTFWLLCRIAAPAGDVAWQAYLGPLTLLSVAYVCLFQVFAVTFRHATIWGLVYAIFMEALIGQLPGIVKRVTLNYYARVLLFAAGEPHGGPAPDARTFEVLLPQTAQAALAGIALCSLLAALAIFQVREYRDLT